MQNRTRGLVATGLTAMTLFFSVAPATAKNPTPPDPIAEAIGAAADGDDGQLEALLEGDSAFETQVALKAWLEERGDFSPASLQGPSEQPDVRQPRGSKPIVLSTGQYDSYCTSYAGVTMGWNGKSVLACHGWMNVYISGNRVAHYSPDLIPRGITVSIGCAYAIGATALSAASIGTIGWASYGVGLLANVGGIVISCP